MANVDLARGFVLGLGAAVAIPVALAAVAVGVPPIRRALGRTGMIIGEKVREGTSELAEVVEDLVAEVQEERQSEPRPAAEATKPAKPQTRRAPAKKRSSRTRGRAA